MLTLFLYVCLFAAAGAASIVLTGDRKMLSADLTSAAGLMSLAVHWKFITAMALSVFTRVLFVVINSTTLSIPALARSATTVTTLATAISYPAIIFANAWWLNERMSGRQYAGAGLIIVGIVLACSQGIDGG